MKQEIKKKALRRLRIIKGQLNGLEKMIEDEKYCIDIITQSSAVKQALSGIEDIILENHLATHAKEQLKTGQRDKLAAEILKVYKLSKKI
ncbi:metal-sensitive transcriptional regulator [Patescibacteria group bacterium]|jgi:DNA-binding FrmR family transcriptional regulator|nr:metal-sensitive transcriptional regulator [Patescibacteria group bacterium]MCL5114825.1 metal-sensitive transcriptional regulator [Patescibacteria group bacterium]